MNIVSQIKVALQLVKSALWPTLQPIVADIGSWTLAVLTDIAYDFVLEAEDKADLISSGDAKRKFVAERMKSTAFVSSNKIATRAINLAIEMAVARMIAEDNQ